jgi:hypothetical protein
MGVSFKHLIQLQRPLLFLKEWLLLTFNTKKVFTMLKSQNLFKAVPFDLAAQVYQQAYQLQLETEQEAWHQRQQREVEQLEEDWTSTHEAPAEFNFSDKLTEQSAPDFKTPAKRAGERAVVESWVAKYPREILAAQPLVTQYLSRHGTNALVTVEGQIDPKLTTQRIFNGFNHLDDRGLWIFLQLNSKSGWLPSQYKDPGRQWCTLVPHLLYAFKANHSIPYSRWSRQGLDWAVNRSLCEAMLCDVPEFTVDELLDIRQHGLRVKSGSKTGDNRNPATTYKLYGTTHPEFRRLPELAQVMLAQIWCAHPENRTKYMILDPKNWDQMPEPLVTAEIFVAPAAKQKTNVKMPQGEVKLPWED